MYFLWTIASLFRSCCEVQTFCLFPMQAATPHISSPMYCVRLLTRKLVAFLDVKWLATLPSLTEQEGLFVAALHLYMHNGAVACVCTSGRDYIGHGVITLGMAGCGIQYRLHLMVSCTTFTTSEHPLSPTPYNMRLLMFSHHVYSVWSAHSWCVWLWCYYFSGSEDKVCRYSVYSILPARSMIPASYTHTTTFCLDSSLTFTGWGY